jgi:hypothetical protein
MSGILTSLIAGTQPEKRQPQQPRGQRAAITHTARRDRRQCRHTLELTVTSTRRRLSGTGEVHMSNNLLEMPVRQAQADQPTSPRITRAQRKWLRRVLGIELPRRRRAAATRGPSTGCTTMKEAA